MFLFFFHVITDLQFASRPWKQFWGRRFWCHFFRNTKWSNFLLAPTEMISRLLIDRLSSAPVSQSYGFKSLWRSFPSANDKRAILEYTLYTRIGAHARGWRSKRLCKNAQTSKMQSYEFIYLRSVVSCCMNCPSEFPRSTQKNPLIYPAFF